MLQDIRYAVRTFRRKPLVAGTAVLVLSLGIAGATAVFSVVHSVLLLPLPYPDAERLVRIWEVTPDGDTFSFSEPNYLDVREQSKMLAEVAAYREVGGHVVLADGGEPQRFNVVPVSASLPTVLGVAAAQMGRLFTPEDDQPGAAAQSLILSNAAWRSRFSGDPGVIGQRVTLNELPFVIVGVLPAAFDFPRGADAWIPLAANRASERDNKDLGVIGRLAPDMTIDQARHELLEIARQLSAAHPVANAGWSARAVPFGEWIVAPRYRDAVWVLFGAVGLLLLLACANVASLLLAQATSRRGELRIRAALGAARRRLAQQMFVESALLAIVATVMGVLMAVWAVDAVRLLGGDRIPRLDTVRIDEVVLAFACFAGVVSCVMFGLAPAVHATRNDLRASLDEGYRYTAGGRRLRHGFVIVEVALALLLLVGAGLMANSFVRLMTVDPGFDTTTLAMPVDLPPRRYPGDRTATFYAELLAEIRAVPGVSAAAATSTNPFREFGFSNSVTPEERAAEAPPSGLVQAGWRSVTPEFFETLRIPVISGRVFDRFDLPSSDRVIVISDSLATRLWPGESAVGKRIYWGGTSGRTRTVVGVVRDIRDVQLDLDTSMMVFLPHAQVDLSAMTVIVRTPEAPTSVAPLLREALRRVDATLPAPPIDRIDTGRLETAAGPRFNLSLLAAFAAIALVLAVTGVSGMVAFNVVERRREIAVRLALGASGTQVARQILWNGLALTLTGVVIGAAGAGAAARVLSSLLYGVQPTDLLTLSGACIVLVISAVVACLVPARQAMRLDASHVLRE